MASAGLPTSHFYTVTMVRKFKRDAKVQLSKLFFFEFCLATSNVKIFAFLAISKDRIEIAPVSIEERKMSTNSAAKLFRSFQRQSPGVGANLDSNASTSGHSSKTVDFHISRIGGGEILEDRAG